MEGQVFAADSAEAFVQQLAVGCVARGYWFYVIGRVPPDKDPAAVDAKLVARYGAGASYARRYRRKRAGLANVRYLRHGRFFVLIASGGAHESFFRDEPYRDVRRDPIRFAGYSVGCHLGTDGKLHASVRIHPAEYRRLRRALADLATRQSAGQLGAVFGTLPFAPFAPVRRQLLNLLRAVNRARKAAGLESVPVSVLRLRRRPVRVFSHADEEAGRNAGSDDPSSIAGGAD